MWPPRNRSIIGLPSSLSITLSVPLFYAKGNTSLEEKKKKTNKKKRKQNEINKQTKILLIRASQLFFSLINAYRY